MIHYKTCPLCSSPGLTSWLKCRDHLVTKKEFELVRCDSCGLITTQDPPEEKEMAGYYQADEYISHNPVASGFLSSIYRFAREYMIGKKRKYIKRAGFERGSLLDIGCGTGHFAASMKKAGWEVTGIEPNDKAREYASSEFGLNVLLPEEINRLSDNSFDCITMWHVMEHFHDPFGYASEVRRLLKPGGMWLVAMPNCGSYDAICYGTNWAAWDVPRHLWHFKPATMKRFADKAGFRITGTGVLPFDVFYISILSERIKGGSFSFIKGLCKGLWFSLRVLSDKSKSSSLYYILKPGEES